MIIFVEFLAPPQALLDSIFPWVEEEQKAYEKRLADHGRKATDYALKNFLEVLVWFRSICRKFPIAATTAGPLCDVQPALQRLR